MTLSFARLGGAWKDDPKFGEFAGLSVNRDRSGVLLENDVEAQQANRPRKSPSNIHSGRRSVGKEEAGFVALEISDGFKGVLTSAMRTAPEFKRHVCRFCIVGHERRRSFQSESSGQ